MKNPSITSNELLKSIEVTTGHKNGYQQIFKKKKSILKSYIYNEYDCHEHFDSFVLFLKSNNNLGILEKK